MRITDIEYKTVSIPFHPIIQEYFGMDYPTTIVWVHTDEGLTGLGESNSSHGSNITDSADSIAERYIGKSIWDIDLSSEGLHFRVHFMI